MFATPDKNPFDRIVTCIEAAAESTLYVDNGIDLLATGSYEEDLTDMAVALGLPVPKPKKPRTKKVIEEKTEEISETTEK